MSSARTEAPASIARALADNWLVIVQLLLAVGVVNLYEIEGPALSRVMTLAAAGFVVDRIGARPVLLFGVAMLALSGLVLGLEMLAHLAEHRFLDELVILSRKPLDLV